MFHTYLNAPQYDNTLFSFALFSCLKNALFLHSTLVLSFYGDVILTFSTKKQYKDTQAHTQTHSKTDKTCPCIAALLHNDAAEQFLPGMS